MSDIAPPLSPAQIKAFKAQAHHLSPVVMVGAAGLTEAVLREVDKALQSHQLIKVKVAADGREERLQMMDKICTELLCAPIQAIGKQIVLYREALDEPADNEPHLPKKLAAQGVTKAPTRGGKARAKPVGTQTRTNPAKLKRGPSKRGTGGAEKGPGNGPRYKSGGKAGGTKPVNKQRTQRGR